MQAFALSQELSARAYLVDLDGTLICDRKPLPGAASLLGALADRFVLVSNDSEHTPAQLATMLARIGLRIDGDRILLAGTSALDMIARERHKPRVMLVGSTALRRYGRSLNLEITDRDPDVVLVARDRRFGFGKLTVVANAVREGAELMVANPDLTHPGRAGSIVPETGALMAAILACTGPVPYRVVGKPEPFLYERALEILGVEAADAVMIGDNPRTDGAGAEALGMGYVGVKPGQPIELPGAW